MDYDILVDAKKAHGGENVYSSIEEAYMAARPGTESSPTVIAIVPDMYKINGSENGSGLVISKPYITFVGLGDSNEDTVIWDNRGAYQGAYVTSVSATMEVKGIGFRMENLTIYNACNVDIIYTKDMTKCVRKRSDVETQSVIMRLHDTADRTVLRGCRFISSMDGIQNNSKRTYYEDCYIEGTKDFIYGRGSQIFNNCHIYCRSESMSAISGDNIHIGTVLINCTIDSDGGRELFLSKKKAPLTLINCVLPDMDKTVTKYNKDNSAAAFFSYYNLTDSRGREVALVTDDLFCHNIKDENIMAYSLYNLLRGEDDWNPDNIKSRAVTTEYLPLRVVMTSELDIRAGGAVSEIAAKVIPQKADQTLIWIRQGHIETKSIIDNKMTIAGEKIDIDEPIDAYVLAATPNGCRALCNITVKPSILPAPVFTRQPEIVCDDEGYLNVQYELNLDDIKDGSRITWYRCDNENGYNRVAMAYTRTDEPCVRYRLSEGDYDKYIFAEVIPKHYRSEYGQMKLVSYHKKIDTEIRDINIVKTDFSTMFIHPYAEMIPGAFMEKGALIYGTGIDGSEGAGLITNSNGCMLMYLHTDLGGDMRVRITLDPEKEDGQGFASPTQYQEIYIKYDYVRGNGYGIRYERTVKNARACGFTLYKYTNGEATPLTDTITSRVFRKGCMMELSIIEGQFKCYCENDYGDELELEAAVEESRYSGMALYHNGSAGEGNRTVIHNVEIEYM